MSFPRLTHQRLVYPCRRALSSTALRRDASRTPTHFTNILADGIPPPVQVTSITPSGILLGTGLILPSACIFLEGKVYLWDVPQNLWTGWGKEHFEVFEAVVPKPGRSCLTWSRTWPGHSFIFDVEILLLGTGAKMALPPPHIRKYMSDIGIQMDFMDTVRHNNFPPHPIHLIMCREMHAPLITFWPKRDDE